MRFSQEIDMFVAISKFTVANGMTAEVKAAFRLHKVDSADGFVRMDVISPRDEPNEIWLITFWADEAVFTAWHHSHLYHESHATIPKGLKLDPKGTQLQFFDHISD
jgi:heme-degrading monooxygenase HmoA